MRLSRGIFGSADRKSARLEANLASLRAYRKKDPGFRKAIAEFVEAEATLEDPLEGEIVGSKPKETKAAGPVQSKIRDILGA